MDWSLGGYGFYVWGSYLVALVAIALEVFSLVKRKKACEQSAQKDQQKASPTPQAPTLGSAAR